MEINLVFLVLKWLVLINSSLVLFSKNPVHSVLFLVLTFCSGALLLLLLQVEFLGLIYIVVYVGAIAVLFLFVVMMLNIKLVELSRIFYFLPVGLFFGFIFFIGLFIVGLLFSNELILTENVNFLINYIHWEVLWNKMENLVYIGELLYTYYFLIFFYCGMVLLLAIIGSILLTLVKRQYLRRQVTYFQHARSLGLHVLRKPKRNRAYSEEELKLRFLKRNRVASVYKSYIKNNNN